MRRVFFILTGLVALAAAGVLAGAGESGEKYLVRAIFDNASFVVKGEDVKVAGVRVGSIHSVDVTRENKAAVILDIEDPAYQDFRTDAECKVRPQSLIGEEFVECTPTQTHPAGEEPPPPLEEVGEGEDGEGQRLLPVENTSASVDLDLIAESMRLPQRQRLALIINELGVGLAGRGEDLNEVIRRAAPAFEELDEVLVLLARQNDTLEQLAVDSDQIMAPLARERKHVTGFIDNASDVAQATAERRAALEQTIQKFPEFLRELEPTMARLGALADEATPVFADLGDQAPAINELIRRMGPFSRAATPALERLGDVAEPGIPAMEASLPIVKDVRSLARQLRPVSKDLADVLESFAKNQGVEYLMDYIYFQALAVNGFDSVSHFLRAGLIVNTCSNYATAPVSGCTSNFLPSSSGSASAASVAAPGVSRRTAEVLEGADPDEVSARDGVELVEPAKLKPRPAPKLKPEPTATPAPAEATDQLFDYLLGSDE